MCCEKEEKEANSKAREIIHFEETLSLTGVKKGKTSGIGLESGGRSSCTSSQERMTAKE